jgi:hypothetical protein
MNHHKAGLKARSSINNGILYGGSQKYFIKKQKSYRHLNQYFHALILNKLCKILRFICKPHYRIKS